MKCFLALVPPLPCRLQSTLSRAPGAKLELCPADLTQQSTLQASYFQGVRALVVCSAVKVQPKEGDTPDRQKYLQV